LRDVRALKPGEIIWDASVTGFTARRQKSEAITYFAFYRTAEGRQHWHTIGWHGAPWTPEIARVGARLERQRHRDPAPNRTAELMGEAKLAAVVVPLRAAG
jgi:hypothetical protein